MHVIFYLDIWRVPTLSCSIERNLDIELVQNTLEENYPFEYGESSTFDRTPQHNHIDIEFWEMLGVRCKSNKSTSSSRSEIEQFMRFPRAKTDVDRLQW